MYHFVPTLFHNLNPDSKDQTKRNKLIVLRNSLGLNTAIYDCSISLLKLYLSAIHRNQVQV